MPSDLDLLMTRISEINSKSAAEVTDHDIEVLIAYHRHNRSRRASGHKPAKLEKPKVDVLGLLNMAPKPKQLGTVRRV